MEAMILAAGAGTRLRPLTDFVPKALVEVGGRPLLARVMDRLAEVGVTRLVINTHHHEDQVRTFLDENTPPGIEVSISPEPDGPYETGGGLFAASHFFLRDAPFLLHNVDVLSKVPLEDLVTAHVRSADSSDMLVASLAVQERDAKRRLVFDDRGLLGWENRGSDRAKDGVYHVREPAGDLKRMAFTGIHVLDPRIFDLSDRTGKFSIITLYLELAARGFVIYPVDMSAYNWIDVGTPEKLAEAEKAV